jgi:putative transposase
VTLLCVEKLSAMPFSSQYRIPPVCVEICLRDGFANRSRKSKDELSCCIKGCVWKTRIVCPPFAIDGPVNDRTKVLCKRSDIRDRVGETFSEIAENHEFEIQEMRAAPDHVHLFLNFPSRKSIMQVLGMLKSISASEVFEEFPEEKKELWVGQFLEDGYFVRTVGDKVRANFIKRYITYHHDEIHGKQLKLF